MKRRTLLAGLGATGIGVGLGGIGTTALYNDLEGAQTTVTAGDLDIQIDWRAFHNDVEFSAGGPDDVDGRLVAEFLDVKPCDEGCIQLSVHNDTNPAHVIAAFEIVDDNDNYLTEPEAEAEDGGFSKEPADGHDDDGCWWAGKLEGWNGSEWTVVENGITTSQTNEYVFMVDAPEKNQEEVRVKLHPETVNGDGELIEYSLESLTDGCGICAVDTNSATVTETTETGGCVKQTGTIRSPAENNQGTPQGISHIEVWVCNTGDGSGEPETDDDGELDECIEFQFFEDPDQDCEPDDGEQVFFGPDVLRNIIDADDVTKAGGGVYLGVIEGTEWFSIDWELPCDCGNETQTDSFGLNVYFYAEQERNNPEVSNPWI